jgi:ribosomal-protein-alanine N-acetyltransferase
MVVFREAVEDDIEVIHGIEQTVYPTAWTLNFFQLMLGMTEDLFLVALENGEVIGYTVGEMRKMGRKTDLKTVGHILNLAVRGDYQGVGVGTLLMDEVEGRLLSKGVDLVYLEVRESNTGPQTMYLKRGYQYVRTAKGYYGDEDGFVMMKRLK